MLTNGTGPWLGMIGAVVLTALRDAVRGTRLVRVTPGCKPERRRCVRDLEL